MRYPGHAYDRRCGEGIGVTLDLEAALWYRPLLRALVTLPVYLWGDVATPDCHKPPLEFVTAQAYAAPTHDVRNFNRRDRGILLYLMKRYPEATDALREYLEADPQVQGTG